jgi:hypothetical protein
MQKALVLSMLSSMLSSVLIVLGLAPMASATSIVVLNPGFENPALTSGSFNTGNTITNWTATGVDTGVFHPVSSQLVPTEGVQVGYSNNGSVTQVLSATLTANTAYTLNVDFLSRKDCCPWPGARLDFIAGSTTEATLQLASLAPGAVQTSTILFTPLPGDPNLGQPLAIRIAVINTGTGQIDFDNVRLDGTSLAVVGTPEPGTTGLLGAGIALFAVAKLRRKR